MGQEPKYTILITGGAGFIGSTLAEELLEAGHRVVCVDNLNDTYPPGIKRANRAAALPDPGYRFCKADVRHAGQIGQVFATEKPDRVVHLAGLTGMLQSFKTPREFFSNNLGGALSVLDACRKAGNIPMIYVSTATVYGSHHAGVREDAPLPPPLNPYAASKRMGEEASAFYHSFYRLPVTVLRLYTVYGPRQRPTMAITRFLSLLLAGKEIPVYGDGKAKRDYLHVRDCTRAIRSALCLDHGFGIFNVGGSSVVTVNETIGLLAAISGRQAKIKRLDAVPGHVPEATVADIGKARRILNFKPEVKFTDGIEQFYQWFIHQS